MLSRSVPSVVMPARRRRALDALARRPALAAAGIYTLLAVLLVAPGLLLGHRVSASDSLWSGAPWTASAPAGVTGLGSNYEQADAVLVFQPAMEYARGRLPHAPLWNPHIMAGRPFLAN